MRLLCVQPWAQLGGGHGGRVPPLFQTVGIYYAMLPHIFLFRFRNILVSHQAVPPTFSNKIALMPTTTGRTEQIRVCVSRSIRREPSPESVH